MPNKIKIIFIVLSIFYVFFISFSNSYLPTPFAGNLKVFISSPINFLDPTDTGNISERLIKKQIFEGLSGYDEADEIYPRIAQSFSLSPDGKTLKIVLRKNVQFHNNELLTAEDVLYSLNRILSNDPDGSFRWTFRYLKEMKAEPPRPSEISKENFTPANNKDLGGMSIVNEFQAGSENLIYLIFQQPISLKPILSALATLPMSITPVPKSEKNKFQNQKAIFYENLFNYNQGPESKNVSNEEKEPEPLPIGSGTFKVISLNSTNQNAIQLASFLYYHQGRPFLNNLEFHYSPEQEPISLIQLGLYQLFFSEYGIKPAAHLDNPAANNPPKTQSLKGNPYGTVLLYYNLDAFSSSIPKNELEEFLYSTIDVDSITSSILHGQALKATGLLPPGWIQYEHLRDEKPSYSSINAKEKLLSFQSETSAENSFHSEQSDRFPSQIKILCPKEKENPALAAVAQRIQVNFIALGISCEIQLLAKEAFLSALKNGQYHLVLRPWLPYWKLYPTALLASLIQQAPDGYIEPENSSAEDLKEILTSLDTLEKDSLDQKQILELEKKVMKNIPAIPLYHPLTEIYANSSIKNISFSNDGLISFENTWIEQ